MKLFGWGMLALTIAGAASASPAQPSKGQFLASLRSAMQQQRLTLPERDDCSGAPISCRLLDLPETLQVWVFSGADGDVSEVNILSEGLKGDPADVAATAQKLCLGSLRSLTRSRVSAAALDKPYAGARSTGEWRGQIGGIAVRLRADTAAALGACHLSRAAGAR